MSNDDNLKGSPSGKTGNVQSKKGATEAPQGAAPQGAAEAPQGATEAPQGAAPQGATEAPQGATEAPQGAAPQGATEADPTSIPATGSTDPAPSPVKVDPFDAKVVSCDESLKALRAADPRDERAIAEAEEALTIAIAERSVARAEEAVRAADEAFKSAVTSGDDDAIVSCAAERKTARAKLDAVKASAGIEAFMPALRMALGALVVPGNVPTGRFTVTVLFEDGKVSGVRRTAIEGSIPSPVKSAPISVPMAASAPRSVRANLSAVDSRIPPQGWSTRTEIQSGGKGRAGSWEVTMLADARCRATSDKGEVVEDKNLASVLRTLTGQSSVDQYARFHLGAPGTVFDPNKPAKGWTFKG